MPVGIVETVLPWLQLALVSDQQALVAVPSNTNIDHFLVTVRGSDVGVSRGRMLASELVFCRK